VCFAYNKNNKNVLSLRCVGWIKILLKISFQLSDKQAVNVIIPCHFTYLSNCLSWII